MAHKNIHDVPDPPQRKRRPRAPAPLPGVETPVIPPAQGPAAPGPAPPRDPASPLAAHRAARMRQLLQEKAERRVASLQLYEPLPAQAAFHASLARVNVVRGSNRAGKTLATHVEVARALTGLDPHGKYPREGGRCFAVGKDLKHVGEVMYRKLFLPGAMKMLRDEATGSWRAYRPWDPADSAREAEARPAPPLVPPRMVADVAWENKKEDVASKVKLVNGWQINFYSSLGKPPQGSDIDLALFDEEIVDPAWFPEMAARLLDRRGRLIWGATPQAGTEALYELHERAEREALAERPGVREFVLLLQDNPHVGDPEKRALAENLTGDERRVRIDGEFAFVSFRVYPEFNLLVHGIDPGDPAFAGRGGPGPDWTRYLVVDPGHQVCAVLFAAVPPPHVDPELVVLYDELYVRDCDAARFAAAVRAKCEGHSIQACVIDPNAAAMTEIGSGKTVGQQYGEALARAGFHAQGTGTGFVMGCDDVDAGLLRVRHWLRSREDGRPRLRVLRGACPNLESEFKRYVKKRVAGMVTDQPNNRRHSHLMDDVRYLALYEPRYVKPRPAAAQPSWALRQLDAKKARRRAREGGAYTNLGPGGAGP